MQNKPNFQDAQMNVNTLITMNYKIFIPLAGQKNKPNSNPIKANFRKAKMNVNSLITKDYRKKDDFTVRKNKPNSNPITERPKMNANVFITRDYENKTDSRPEKTNPIKANFRKAWQKATSEVYALTGANNAKDRISAFLYPSSAGGRQLHH